MNKAGTMNGGLVWVFALAAVAVGVAGAWATAGLGSTISSAVFFGAFLVAGFLGVFLTRAKTGIAVLAFAAASALTAGIYYTITAGMGGGDEAGGLGAVLGIFFAAIALVVSIVGGISGCVAGARFKGMAQQASR
jgi:hypothetical protein